MPSWAAGARECGQLSATAIDDVGSLLLLTHDMSWIPGPCECVVNIDGFARVQLTFV